MNSSDSDLLRKYAEDRCEASFTELVNRRVGLVFAAALRQRRGRPKVGGGLDQLKPEG